MEDKDTQDPFKYFIALNTFCVGYENKKHRSLYQKLRCVVVMAVFRSFCYSSYFLTMTVAL